ncbi:MAG: hypothetical protein U5P41_12705 [Gammaproteobacteria bacterium]|nr:hypothetical protein [Gammaproteobacteria bacterium]
MSDTKNPFPFWNTDWLEAQRKYMDAWTALSGNQAEQGKTDSGSGDTYRKSLEQGARILVENGCRQRSS